jgi:hypothetical protein
MFLKLYCLLPFLIVRSTVEVLKWKKSLVYVSNIRELKLAYSLNV